MSSVSALKVRPSTVTVALGLYGRANFSADGSKLTYAKGRLVSNVWRVPILSDRPANWEDATPLTGEQAYIDSVDVCRNGALITFSSDRASTLDLWMMPADGGELRQLTSQSTSDWAPSWSPDCREIVFHSDRSGNRDIWAMPVEPGPAPFDTYLYTMSVIGRYDQIGAFLADTGLGGAFGETHGAQLF